MRASRITLPPVIVGLEWIDRLEAKFTAGDRVASPEMRAHVKEQLDAARVVYRKALE